MATTLKKTNVVIVGMGGAGGLAALPFAQAGMDVIGLEAGSWLKTSDMVPDELGLRRKPWPPAPQKVRGEAPTSRANASANATRAQAAMINGVGGTTMHYMAQAWRLNPWDFKVVSEVTKRYGKARLPAGSTVEDWPFSYEDLEPFYDKAEYALGISGKAGNLKGTKHPSGNIFEGVRSREYPVPALRNTGFMDHMSKAAKSIGLNPFVGPAAILSQTYEGRFACGYHGYCMSLGCHLGAKSSPAFSTIPAAQKTGKLDVVTEAAVTRIEVQVADGRLAVVVLVRVQVDGALRGVVVLVPLTVVVVRLGTGLGLDLRPGAGRRDAGSRRVLRAERRVGVPLLRAKRRARAVERLEAL